LARLETSVAGVLFALGAFSLWGVFPLYWTQLAHVLSSDVLSHRIIWSLPLLAILIGFRRQWGYTLRQFADFKQLRFVIGSTVLISINWGIYIWAAANERVIEASFGYFLTPLFSVLLGRVFFGEKLRRLQRIAVACAAIGVALQTVLFDSIPWISLILGISFAGYGALRKSSPQDPMSALFAECALAFPAALAWLVWLSSQALGSFGSTDTSTTLLLVLGGFVTAVPLLLFGEATRRLHLSTTGLLFYLTPTIQFLIGWKLLGEPITLVGLVSFCFIWAGVVVFAVEGFRYARTIETVNPGG
jgi:chloramphenicol-sensitive protein RarD